MPTLFSDIVHGIATGFLVSIPIGPVALITIQRSAEYGWRAGLVSIAPVAALDSIAVMLVLLGLPLTFFSSLSVPHFVGSIVAIGLFVYGFRLYRSAAKPSTAQVLPWHRNFFTSLAVSLANPATYIGFVGLAFLFSQFADRTIGDRIAIGISFCVGALLWWCGLVFVASTQRNHQHSKKIAQRIASAILMLTALIMLFPPHYFAQYIKLLSRHV